MSKKVSKRKMKHKILVDRLKEENPEIRKEMIDFSNEVAETWKRISPYVGEEDAYGVSSLAIDDEHVVIATPFDIIYLFVLFKRVFDKLDRELKWFKKNKEILEMMVKEYLNAEKLR